MEILLNMPEQITDEPSSGWRCTGHVVRVETVDSVQGKLGVGVQFDCYEVSRVQLPVGSSDTAPEAMAEAIFSAR